MLWLHNLLVHGLGLKIETLKFNGLQSCSILELPFCASHIFLPHAPPYRWLCSRLKNSNNDHIYITYEYSIFQKISKTQYYIFSCYRISSWYPHIMVGLFNPPLNRVIVSNFLNTMTWWWLIDPLISMATCVIYKWAMFHGYVMFLAG
jgi:hypothetical protein